MDIPKKIEISHRTIIFTVLLLAGVWLLGQIYEIVLMVFVACILVAALNPLVDRLERRKISRGISILIVYLFLVIGIGILIASVIPGLVSQSKSLIQVLPNALNNMAFFTDHQQELSNQLLSRIGSLPENLLKASVNIFGNLLNIVTTLVISFYLLMYRPKLNSLTHALFGPKYQTRIEDTVLDIEKRLGSWVRGELLLMVAVGSLTYLGLVFLRIDIALPLAILAGVLEIVPNIGPLISAIPSVIVGLAVDPLTGLATASWYFLVQLLENHLLVPNIMRKTVGVNPLISILALMTGFKLAGPIGAILSIPVLIIIRSIVVKFFSIDNLSKLAPGDE